MPYNHHGRVQSGLKIHGIQLPLDIQHIMIVTVTEVTADSLHLTLGALKHCPIFNCKTLFHKFQICTHDLIYKMQCFPWFHKVSFRLCFLHLIWRAHEENNRIYGSLKTFLTCL